MTANEYGLSNLISSLWMTDKHVENQWEAIYPTNTPCLFTFGHNLSSCVIWIVWDFLSLDLSKKNRAVPAVCLVCCSLSWFNEWPGFLSTKKGHRKKFASAVLPTLQVEITRRSNSAFIRCRSLWLGFPTLFNQESFTELTFTLTTSLVNSDSCRYKLDLHKSTAFVRQLSGRSLVINLY